MIRNERSLGPGRPPRSASEPRGVSTVLDVAVFLLLVSAAVGILYAAPDAGDSHDDADVAPAVATTLATTTTGVEYAPHVDGAAGAVRTQRGSILALLARTTVANAAWDDAGSDDAPASATTADAAGSSDAPAGATTADAAGGLAPAYEAAVRNETRAVLRSLERDVTIQVRAVWEPLSGSGLRGETVVGPSPPPGTDVHAATTTVPVGSPPATAGANDASGGASARNCRVLAEVVARDVIGQRFPTERTSATLRGDGGSRERVSARYRAVAASLGIDPDEVPRGTDATGTNARLTAALASQLEPTACEGYADTSAAAGAAAPAAVTVVVRAWSR